MLAVRDAAAAAGRAADRLGARAPRHPPRADRRRRGGRPASAAARSTPSSSAATAWRPTATPPTRSAPTPSARRARRGHPVRGGRPDVDDRPRDCPTATPSRSRSATATRSRASRASRDAAGHRRCATRPSTSPRRAGHRAGHRARRRARRPTPRPSRAAAGVRVARSLDAARGPVEDARSRRRAGRGRLPRAGVWRLRVGRQRRVGRAQGPRRCSATSWPARSTRWAPGSRASRSATAWSSTTTRRAASAGAAAAGTRRCASASADGAGPGRVRRAGPRPGRARRELLVLDGLDAERGDVRGAAGLCAARTGSRSACGRATACWSSAAGRAGCWRSPPRTRAPSRRCGPRAATRAPGAGARAGAERHGNELVDVAIVCTPKPAAIAAGFAAVAPGGALCLYAPPEPGHALDLDGQALYVGEVDVCASYSAGPATCARRWASSPAASRSAALRHPPRRPRRDGPRARAGRSGEAIKALVVP